jgi:hypothetical protein
MFSDLGVLLNIRGEASAGIATCQMVARGLGFTLADPLEAHYVPSDRVVVRDLVPRLCFTYGFPVAGDGEPDRVDGAVRRMRRGDGAGARPRSTSRSSRRAASRCSAR